MSRGGGPDRSPCSPQGSLSEVPSPRKHNLCDRVEAPGLRSPKSHFLLLPSRAFRPIINTLGVGQEWVRFLNSVRSCRHTSPAPTFSPGGAPRSVVGLPCPSARSSMPQHRLKRAAASRGRSPSQHPLSRLGTFPARVLSWNFSSKYWRSGLASWP